MKYIIHRVLLPLLALGMLALMFWLGYRLGPPEKAAVTSAGDATYTCPMHPQFQLPEMGKCPICFMDLVVMEDDRGGAGELVLDGAQKKLAEIEVVPAELRFVSRDVRMRGKVDFDETRQGTIAAYVSGRIDKLFVNYTGLPVQTGAPLALLYSPQLYTAQEELLEARRQVDEAGTETSEFLRASNVRTLESSREKLRLLGLDAPQIASIEKEGKARKQLLIKAPLAGIVIRKGVREGDYVQTGSKLFEIADLRRLWVRLDAYESDLPWLRYGQVVKIAARAWPGEEFTGRISFIDPVLDNTSRTVKVRVVVNNPKGQLKPGMFVRARVASRLSRGGRVAAPELAGKWISPVHPDVIRDEPGNCPVCGVPLVRATDLGYLDGAAQDARPLVVPATAVLRTGVRSLVYVEKPNTVDPTYESRQIRVGPQAGNYWIVLSGLEAGEKVVVKGNFKIDSAMQLAGKQAMMSPPGGAGSIPPRARITPEFRQGMDRILGAYFDLWLTLSGDDLAGAMESAGSLRQGVDRIAEKWLEFMDRPDWQRERRALLRYAGELEKAGTIEAARVAFAPLSDAMTTLVTIFGPGSRPAVYRVHCPMAFDNRGGWWLQSNDKIRNPYFGASMLKCGTLEMNFSGEKGK